jgi:HK97 family phage portal protein
LSLIRSVADFAGVRANAVPNPADDFWYGPAVGNFLTASGIKITPESAMRAATVMACIGAISRPIASLPLKLYEDLGDKGKRAASDHPLYDKLYWQPNPWQTAYEFKQMGQVHFELRGNFFVEIIADPKQPIFPLMLVPLHPDRIRVFRIPMAGGGWAPDYQYNDPITREMRHIAQEDMFHLRNLAGGDGLVGYTQVEIFAETIGAAIAAQDYGARFFANDAKPGTIITGAKFKNEEDQNKFRANWQKSQTAANRHKTAILPDGMDIKELGLTNTDAQFIEARKMAREEICGIYGVPLHKVGAEGKVAAYASVEQFNIQFATDCIAPRLVCWEQAIQRDLIAPSNQFSGRKFFAKFLMAALLRGDMLSRYEAYKIGRDGGWLCPNVILELEDMNPIEGGDQYLQPMNMSPLGTEADPAAPAKTKAPPAQQDDGTDARRDERLLLLSASAACRAVRREVNAVRKLLAGAAEASRDEQIAAFYEDHVGWICQAMGTTTAVATRFTNAHKTALLHSQNPEALLSLWESQAPSELAEIAGGTQ